MKRIFTLLFFFFSVTAIGYAQQRASLTQQVRGRVLDAASGEPLAGVVVVVKGNEQLQSATDADGYYTLTGVAVGRQSIQYIYPGYEDQLASEVMVISGKELELNMTLKENLKSLKEVTVNAQKDRARPLNDMATVSARSFSVEETRRYAASFADPARMVMNFPGVSNAGDFSNGIVVRGNAPTGVLWRLEGIEIPNPNHFGGLGATGGAISMLNANVLGSSDFYTGAFPSEIGNALSGAFDLNFRNGNTERREHTVQVGALGLEVATEGPFSNNSKASYLINYRYSTLALLGRFLDLGGAAPDYQDASFKLNFPTKRAGTFSVFGLGGYNTVSRETQKDSTVWSKEDEYNMDYKNSAMMATAGISHQYQLNKSSYLKTVLSASYDDAREKYDTLNQRDNYNKVPVSQSHYGNTAYRLAVLYNNKLNSRHTLRTGVVTQNLSYDLDYTYFENDEAAWKSALASKGQTQYYQAYIQWKHRLNDRLTTNIGIHASYLALNATNSIEPRAAITYEVKQHKISLAAGLHSKPQQLATYFYQDKNQAAASSYPNKELGLQKAFHGVAGYSTSLPWQLRLKAEFYYQKLYSIAVEQDSSTGFSMINAESAFELLQVKKPLATKGGGENYGIDISLEKPFQNGYYLLLTGSVYSSTYKDFAGKVYNTRYNRGHQLNLIGGKEFKLNVNGNRLLGLNGKLMYSGGLRQTPIDLPASIDKGETVYVPDTYFSIKGAEYFRLDMSAYYKWNRRKSTHSILFEVQNLTNRQNPYSSYFDTRNGEIKTVYQMGFFPNISYRVDFH
jgi:hypothetical protein